MLPAPRLDDALTWHIVALGLTGGFRPPRTPGAARSDLALGAASLALFLAVVWRASPSARVARFFASRPAGALRAVRVLLAAHSLALLGLATGPVAGLAWRACLLALLATFEPDEMFLAVRGYAVAAITLSTLPWAAGVYLALMACAPCAAPPEPEPRRGGRPRRLPARYRDE